MKHYGTTTIKNANIVFGDQIIEKGTIRFAEGVIEFVGSEGEIQESSLPNHQEQIIDAKQGWIIPGFIDVHVHGGFGCDFMDANRKALDEITRFHSANGTTAMLATTVTAPKKDIEQVLLAVKDYTGGEMPYAQLLGVHLEGPFISPKWPGAQNPAYIEKPQIAWLKDWVSQHPHTIRMLTLAPEGDSALELIEWITSQGIVAAAGHTDASYDDVQKAVESGLRHAVHTFNAMKGLHHREPGTVGAVMNDDRISAEIIADGHHVHPACIQLLAKVKMKDNLLLITDAISAAGLGDGSYNLGGLEVEVREGVARLKHGDSLAGSTLTMIDAFRFAVEKAGLSIPQASRMASGNPAKMLGMETRIGSLHKGMQADVLLLSPDLQMHRMWIKGRENRM